MSQRFIIQGAAIILILAGTSGMFWLHAEFQKPFSAFGWKEAAILIVCLFLVITAAIVFFCVLLGATKELTKKLLLGLTSLFLIGVFVEAGLRLMGVNSSYMEIREGKFISAYIRKDKNINRTYGSGTTTYMTSPEYKYSRHHNNYGFSDEDFLPKSDSGQILIQTYGDSFTEGDGAPADSSYPALLRQLFRGGGMSNVVIQNFGICGNDPGFYWQQLKDIGLLFNPDVVVIMYGTYDLNTDFFCRGGLERFKNGYWQGYPPPTWEWIYAGSYIFRLFIHVFADVKAEYFLTNELERKERLKSLELLWNQAFREIAELTCSRNIRVLLVKKPERSEVDANAYTADFTFFERMTDTIRCFRSCDLLRYYRDSVRMDENSSARFYWKKDGHHNSSGYEVMARGVYTDLKMHFPNLIAQTDTTAQSFP